MYDNVKNFILPRLGMIAKLAVEIGFSEYYVVEELKDMIFTTVSTTQDDQCPIFELPT